MVNKLFKEAFAQTLFMAIYCSLSANPVSFIPWLEIFSWFDAMFTKTTQKTNVFHSKRSSQGRYKELMWSEKSSCHSGNLHEYAGILQWPVWMNKKLLDKLKDKKEACRGWKQGQVA